MPAIKTITVSELKAQLAAALDAVRAGKILVVTYGRKRTKVAALVPYAAVLPANKRRLGVLAGRGCVRIGRNFAISHFELLDACAGSR